MTIHNAPLEYLSIRNANLADADLLSALCITTFYETYCTVDDPQILGSYVRMNFAPATIRASLVEKDTWWLIGYIGQAAVAYACLTTKNNGTQNMQGVQLERAYVMERFHGMKHGRTLLKYCEDFVRSIGQSWIWSTILDVNIRAQHVAEKEGFSRVREILVPYDSAQETHYLYSKSI